MIIKRLAVLVLTLMSFTAMAQGRHTEVKVYVPLRTYHYDRTPYMEYHDTEGGNIGAIGIYRRTNGKWFNDIQAGAVRNSYDKLSLLAQFGVGRSIGKFDASINLGLITGYKFLFADEVHTGTVSGTWNGQPYEYTYTNVIENDNPNKGTLPSWMEKNGILPSASLTLSYDLGIISPLIAVTPQFINAGIVISL